MMEDPEEELFVWRGYRATVPDGDEFLFRLHREIRRRAQTRRKLMITASALVLMSVFSLGFFLSLENGGSVEWGTGSELLFLSSYEEESVYMDSVRIDQDFVVEAVDYLVQNTDFATEKWGILEDLDDLGIVDSSELQEREESS